jgi:hypothetical protein
MISVQYNDPEKTATVSYLNLMQCQYTCSELTTTFNRINLTNPYNIPLNSVRTSAVKLIAACNRKGQTTELYLTAR